MKAKVKSPTPKTQSMEGVISNQQKLLTTNEIDSVIRKNLWFINRAKLFIQHLSDLEGMENAAIFILSDEGCILHINANKKLIEEFNSDYLILGTYPRPLTLLAKGLGKARKEPESIVEVSGSFILKSVEEKWSCWLAPIIIDTTKIIGNLAICLPTVKGHNHIRNLVKQCIFSIQRDLENSKDGSQLKKLRGDHHSDFIKLPYASLILDENGVIQLANNLASEALGVKKSELEKKQISSLIPSWANLPKLSSKRQFVDNIEVLVENTPKAGLFLLSISATKFSSGKVVETCCLLQGLWQLLSLANRYIGNVATKTFDDIISASPKTRRLVKEARLISQVNSPVLIIGEKHTGKHLFAQAIHNESRRSNGGFVRVDLTQLSKEGRSQVLWGYESIYRPHVNKTNTPGAFEFADGGTVFINEVGLLTSDQQEKLLKYIETSMVCRFGSKQLFSTNARLIAASSFDLAELISEGKFRKDLFYALSAQSLRLLPLRDRKPDIPLLLNHFGELLSKELNIKMPEIPKNILLILRRYEWPHNIKEMKTFLEIIIKDEGKMFEDFKNERDFKRRHLYLEKQQELSEVLPLEEQEKIHIEKAYRAFNGSISKTARRLKISRNTLYLKLKRYGIS